VSISDLGSLGEFVASFGVLITLIFLTFQMRQNTKAVRASIASDMTSHWLSNSNVMASSSDLFQIMARANETGSMEAEGAGRYYFWVVNVLKIVEFAHYQRNEGTLDEQLWETNVAGLRSLMDGTIFEEIWTSQRNLYTADFRGFVDALLTER